MDTSADTTLTIPANTVATYQNGYRFLNLSTPLDLAAGNYMVWAENLGGAGNDAFGQQISTFDGGTANVLSLGIAVYNLAPTSLPNSRWDTAPNSDMSATFIFYNPRAPTANLLPITTPLVLGGAAGSTPTLDLQGANQQVASLADVADAEVFGVVTNSATDTPVILTLTHRTARRSIAARLTAT